METLTENSLIVYLDNNKVEPETKTSLLQSFETFFNQTQEWKDKAEGLVITSADQKEEIKQAKEARLALKNIRVSTEHKRKELKEESLRKGQTIDAIAKIITNQILPIEEHLEKQEKFVEIQEAKRKAELKETREASLAQYDVEGQFYDLGNMPDETFNNLLENSRLAHEAKVVAALNAEKERIAAEKTEAEARAEQARIEAEERENLRLENERLKKEQDDAIKREQIRIASEKKNADNLVSILVNNGYELTNNDNYIEPEYHRYCKGDTSVAYHELFTMKEADLIDGIKKTDARIEEDRIKQAELDNAKAEAERLEKELRDKEAEEARKLLEEQERAEAELSKGDKEKFLSLIADLENLKTKYSFKSKKHNALQASVNELLTKTITYAQSKI